MSRCKTCGTLLNSDDIGATLRFVHRESEEFWCVPCLAKKFACEEAFLRDKIRFLKEQGCTVFPDCKR